MRRTVPLLITALAGIVLIASRFIPAAESWGEVADDLVRYPGLGRLRAGGRQPVQAAAQKDQRPRRRAGAIRPSR